MNTSAGKLDMPAVPVCAIGASAGGVQALKEFFRHVPEDLGLAYVVIIHLNPDQPSSLSEILATVTKMPVRQVQDTPELKPNCVYVIAPDSELVLTDHSVSSRPFSDPRGHRAPIDVFFRSVAVAQGDGLAVILSGAGSDGALGVQAIKEGGGIVFVQEPADAEYPMMPRSALAAGVADFVAPIPRLVERLVEVTQSKDAVRSLSLDAADHVLQRIVSFLRARTGHDFSSYKKATVMRRVGRRMQVTRCREMTEYAKYLANNPEEAQELFSDLLISVTAFFRDYPAFKVLAEEGIGSLFENAGEEGIRAWVAGCATGEEAYSLAILLLEEAERRRVTLPIQIFATDLDEGALGTAREGRYPASIEADVSDERLRRYFTREGLHYRVKKEVRDTVLFASHSVIKDPPFMRLDIITCRNLLIYVERQTQQEICALFAYGLKPHGLLFLGSAETIDATPDLFSTINREARLYRARPQASRRIPLLSRMPPEHLPPNFEARPRDRPRDQPETSLGVVHADALERAAPPSALVDRQSHLLHLSPGAGRFLLLSGGPASVDIAAMVRPELRLDIRSGVRRAFEQGETTLTMPIPVAFDGHRRRVMIQVTPVLDGDGMSPLHALIVFLDGGPVPDADQRRIEGATVGEISRLREALNGAEARLAASRAEHETAIQDLRIANEELQSINEEYRSTSEELETSKEELQSMNEELRTVNAELKSKLESIGAAHSDLENIIAATDIGTLFLDLKLRIRMFTPHVAKLFNVTDADAGRVVTDFTHRLRYDGLAGDAERVLRDLVPVEREVETSDASWLMMRLRPYRTVDDRIVGVVATFVDITESREAHRRVRESEERQGFLLGLADALRPLTDAAAMQGEVCRALAEWLDVDRAYYVEVDEAAGVARVERDVVRHEARSLTGEHRLDEFGWSVRILRGGECFAVPDTQSSDLVPDAERAPTAALGIIACMGAPLVKGGALAGALCVTARHPRDWTRQEVGVLRETADRLWSAVETARAEAALRASEQRFGALVRATSDALYRMNPDWSEMIELGGSASMADIRDGNRNWMEAYVDPADLPELRARIDEAIATKVPLELEHRVRRGDDSVGWTLSRAVPILDAQGEIAEWFGTASDITGRRLNEERLREARDALALATAASQLGWGTWDFSSGVANWDARGREIIGLAEDETTIKAWLDRVHPDDREAFRAEIEICAREGRDLDLEYRVVGRDGSKRQVHGTGVFQPSDGGVARGTGLIRDITELHRWRESQRLLVGELNHRVKNMLAVVQSVAHQTRRTTAGIEEFATAFEQRLQAIAAAHSLLTQQNWKGADLRDLIHVALGSFATEEGRLQIEGQRLTLRPDATISFAMALHELATNALKYGALKNEHGRVEVRWQVADGNVIFGWSEHDGPPVLPPSREGFGTRLLERGIARELGGRVQVDYESDGVRWVVEFPLDKAD